MSVTPGIIRRLPKSDLHSHTDGSVPARELFAIAKRHRRRILTPTGRELLTAESFRRYIRGVGYDNLLEDILDRFFPIVGLMQTEEVLRDVGFAYVRELEKHNVAYAEGRFAPQYHTREGLTCEQAIAGMAEGLREGSERYGVPTKLIVAIGRETDGFSAEKVARAAVSSRDAVALDLGGPEEGNPPGRFREAFRIATRGSLKKTVHAGEGAGSLRQNLSNIRSAIVDLETHRVGHAIDISKDPSLVELARERSVTLEMNPVSNVVLKKIAGPRDLRIDYLMKSGIHVTVNSDDPALWPSGSIKDVLLEVCRSYSFGLAELDRLLTDSFLGSFATQREKEALMDEYSWARGRSA